MEEMMAWRVIILVFVLFAITPGFAASLFDEADCKRAASYYNVPGGAVDNLDRRLVSCVNYLLNLQDKQDRYFQNLLSLVQARIDTLQNEIARLDAKLANNPR
jgi:hypothetical protein